MITMPGEERTRPATGAHYNPSMRVPKGLFGFPVIKVATGELFQASLDSSCLLKVVLLFKTQARSQRPAPDFDYASQS